MNKITDGLKQIAKSSFVYVKNEKIPHLHRLTIHKNCRTGHII